MGNRGEVDAVCVDYRTPCLAAASLAGLGRQGLAARILVEVDPLPGRAIPHAGPRVAVPNRGFGVAANEGARRGKAPWILFLNADCRPSAGLVEGLLEVARGRPRVGAVGPRLVDAQGRDGVSHGADLDSLGRLLGRGRPPGGTGPRPVDWVSGACMLVRRAAFEAVGGFCERFFLYCEDADLCRRLRARGQAVLHEPRLVAEHLGAASAMDPAARAAAYRQGRATYLARHAGPAAYWAWRLWLLATGQPAPPAGGLP